MIGNCYIRFRMPDGGEMRLHRPDICYITSENGAAVVVLRNGTRIQTATDSKWANFELYKADNPPGF